MTEATGTTEIENVEIPDEMKELGIVQFDDIFADLDRLKAENKAKVFKYDDPKENKEARSLVATLRTRKTAIDTIRKAQQADALKRGKTINAYAKKLTEGVQEMIDFHDVELKKVKEAEEKRIAGLEEMVKALMLPPLLPATSADTQAMIDDVDLMVIGDEYAEKKDEAASERANTLTVLKAHCATLKVNEAEAIELEQFRKEKAERKEAEAKAAEAKAKADAKELEDKKAEEAKVKAAEDEKQRKIDEDKRVKEAADAAVAKAEADLKAKAAEEKAAEEKRKSDKNHHDRIINQIEVAFCESGIAEDIVDTIVEALIDGKIPHVSIKF